MDNAELTDQEHKLWILLHQARDAVLKVRDNELNKHGLTAVEFGALHIIKTIGGEATPAMVSKHMLRQHHSVTALLKRMENKGLVTRTKSRTRKNTWIINLTEKGQEAFKQSFIIDSVNSVMSVLTEDEKIHLEEYLTKLRDSAIRYAASSQVQLPTFP